MFIVFKVTIEGFHHISKMTSVRRGNFCHKSTISSPVMVLMVKLIDGPSSDERNFSANKKLIPICIFLAVSDTFLDHLSYNCGQSSWKPSRIGEDLCFS